MMRSAIIVALILAALCLGVVIAGEIIYSDKVELTEKTKNNTVIYYEDVATIAADDKCLADVDAWLVANPEPDSKTADNATLTAWYREKPQTAPCYHEVIETVQKEAHYPEAWQEIEIRGEVKDSRALNVWAYEEGDYIIVKSNLDGDGFTHRKEIKPGTSYCVCRKDTGICGCEGHLKITLREAMGAVE